jgi:hypothetical protein
MPTADGPVVISNMPRGGQLVARSPFAQHHFVGGNVFMLKLFKTHGKALGLTAGTEHLDATLARTAERLETGTAQLSVVSAEVAGDTLSVVVEVTSLAGHKFPTGFPSRRAWIRLTLVDGEGNVFFESGQPLASGGIAGNDADEDGARYEPHYDLITNPDQVQVYESIMHNSDGQVTYTLLRAASYAKDNRLLPRGFDRESAREDIAVWGAAAVDDTFAGGSDRVTYQIDARAYSGPFTVSAELLYQSISYRFAQDLRQQDTVLVERMSGYYDMADHTPVIVAAVQETVREDD